MGGSITPRKAWGIIDPSIGSGINYVLPKVMPSIFGQGQTPTAAAPAPYVGQSQANKPVQTITGQQMPSEQGQGQNPASGLQLALAKYMSGAGQ